MSGYGNQIKQFIGMRYHRNGVGGHGAVVTIFESVESGVMVATSLVPDLDESLTPSAYQIERYGEQEAYVEAYLDRFATDTVVLTVEQVAAHNVEPAWRGADYYGREIAREYRRRSIERVFYPNQPGFDPALEWYHEKHPEKSLPFPLPRPEGFVPTEEQSADIKAFLDTCTAQQVAAVFSSYPLESDEWMEETRSGQRTVVREGSPAI